MKRDYLFRLGEDINKTGTNDNPFALIQSDPLPTVDNNTKTNESLNTFNTVQTNNNNTEALGKAIANATSTVDSGQDTNEGEDTTVSDLRCKNIKEHPSIVEAIAALNAYKFKYNEKAKNIPNSESKGVDDDTHVGVLAQELKDNPITETTVKRDPLSDYLTVDTKELTLTNTAILSELCKRVLQLERGK